MALDITEGVNGRRDIGSLVTARKMNANGLILQGDWKTKCDPNCITMYAYENVHISSRVT